MVYLLKWDMSQSLMEKICKIKKLFKLNHVTKSFLQMMWRSRIASAPKVRKHDSSSDANILKEFAGKERFATVM